jgi:hypothetical protein
MEASPAYAILKQSLIDVVDDSYHCRSERHMVTTWTDSEAGDFSCESRRTSRLPTPEEMEPSITISLSVKNTFINFEEHVSNRHHCSDRHLTLPCQWRPLEVRGADWDSVDNEDKDEHKPMRSPANSDCSTQASLLSPASSSSSEDCAIADFLDDYQTRTTEEHAVSGSPARIQNSRRMNWASCTPSECGDEDDFDFDITSELCDSSTLNNATEQKINFQASEASNMVKIVTFADAIDQVRKRLTDCKDSVVDVAVAEGHKGWAVTIYVKPEQYPDLCVSLSMPTDGLQEGGLKEIAQQSVLMAVEESEIIHVLGCEGLPFTSIPSGFSCILQHPQDQAEVSVQFQPAPHSSHAKSKPYSPRRVAKRRN